MTSITESMTRKLLFHVHPNLANGFELMAGLSHVRRDVAKAAQMIFLLELDMLEISPNS